jgi:LysR family transcriptional regulator, low CO2-responsive transcriptional regulator
MEFDQLRTFLVVLEHGSFTRAAEVLALSQSTVSVHIKALEGAVGVRLLERSRERVLPTAQGRILRRYAAQLLALRDEAVEHVTDAEGGAGHVAIAASTIPGEYMLPPALTQLRAVHPRVSVTVSVSDSRRAIASLLVRECDLALVGSRAADGRIVQTAFAEDEIVVVGPASSPWGVARGGSLEGVPLVLRSEGSGTRDAAAGVLAEVRGTAEPAAVIEVGSTEAAKRCALAGLGVAFISRFAVAGELERGELEVWPVTGTPIRRAFFVAYLRSATLSAAAATLFEILTRGE